jgi:lambda family phage tail tape measure protein
MAKSVSTVTLELDKTQFERGIKSAQASVKGLESTTATASNAGVGYFSNLNSAVGKLAAGAENLTGKINGFASAITGLAIGSFVSGILQSSDAIKDLSESFGVSVEKILEVEAGFKRAGRSTSQMGLALATFEASMEAARDGSAKAQAQLEKFGLTEEVRNSQTKLESFNQMMRVLASSSGDASAKVAAVGLAGRGIKTISATDFVEGLDQATGNMGKLADSTILAAETQKKLEQSAKDVQNAFLNLLAPVLEFLNGIIGKGNSANVIATGLGVALAGLVGSAVINGLKTLVGLFTSAASAMGITTGATASAVVATNALTGAEVAFLSVKQAEAGARAASLQTTIAENRARLAEIAVMQSGTVATVELTMAKRALMIASGQLVTAQAGLAASQAGLTAAMMGGSGAMAATAASGGLLAGIMASITSAFTSLGAILFRIGAILLPVAAALAAPAWAVIAAGVAVVTAALTAGTVIWKAFGTEISNSIAKGYAWAKEWAGGIYDSFNSTLDKIANKMRTVFGMTPNLPTGIHGGRTTMANDPRRTDAKPDDPPAPDLKPWLTAELSLKNQYATQKLTVEQALQRLAIEKELIGATEQQRISQLGNFDAQIKAKNDLAKIDQEIAVLESTIAQGGEEAAKREGGRLAIMQAQRAEMAKFTTDQVLNTKLQNDLAVNAEKTRNAIRDSAYATGAQVTAYTQANTQVTNRLALETQLMGMGRDTAQLESARADLVQRTTDKVRELTEAMAKLRGLSDAEDPNREQKIKFFEDAIKQIKQQGENDKKFLDENILGQQKKRKGLEEQAFVYDLMNTAQTNAINLQNEMAKLTMNSDQQKIADLRLQNELQAQQQILKEQSLLGVDKDGKQIILDLQRQLAIKEEIAKANTPLIEGTQALIDKTREWSTGWESSFAQYKSDAENAAKQSQTYFTTFSKGVEDAFVKFVQTGKLSFKDLANSMIADFARIQAQKMLSSAFGGGGGGGFFGKILGSIFGGGGGAGAGTGNAMANGGQVDGNTPYMIGERGPEMFVPKSAGKIVPNHALGGGGSNTVNNTAVSYNISAVDAQSFKAMLARDPEFIHNVAEQGRRSMPIRSRR